MAHLRSAALIITDLDIVGHAPITIPFNHPLPGQTIEIVRALTRLHLHGTLPHPGSVTAFVLRASDQSIVGGAVLDSNPTGPQYLDEHLLDYTPNSYVLGPQDNLLLNVQMLETPADAQTEVGVSALISWFVKEPAKFVNIITAGNRFIGLKDDGTFWQSANVAPLAWTQV